MLKASRAHLADVGETYFEHMRFALLVGALAIGAGLACMLHAIVPGLCQSTCSRTIGLLQQLFADRSRLPMVVEESSGVLIFVVLLLVSCATAVVIAVCTLTTAIGLIVMPQVFALPLIYLWQNAQLEPLAPA
jgi:hypothetical protein